jgi:two-component system sensor histidine kinase TtrS
MAASVAHEVNQPLGAIANYAQGCSRRLEAGSADPQELLKTVRAIGREALRAGTITRRVRELLRKEEPQTRPLDISVLVRNAVEITAAAAAERGVRIGVDLAPTLPEMLGDPIQIEQVLLNLLLNAIDAASGLARPGRVTISTVATLRDGIAVVVADNGTGIDPGMREQIFQPFYTTKPGGLGMGLAISRSIIEAHGGRLSVQPGARLRHRVPIHAAGGGRLISAIARDRAVDRAAPDFNQPTRSRPRAVSTAT